MLKHKIYNYFLSEIFKTFFIILFALTAIAWTVRAANFLDLIVDSGFSIKTYIFYSMLNLSSIITKFIPLSFLLALTLSIIKFDKQNEFMILWTSGLKKIKMVNFVFFVSILFVLIQLFFSTLVSPYFLEKARLVIRSSSLETFSAVVKSKDFSDTFKGTTFYIDKKKTNNEINKIFIRDVSKKLSVITDTQDEAKDVTIVANSGYIDGSKLTLSNGSIQSINFDGKIKNIIFSKLDLVLDNLSTRTIKQLKIQETPTISLLNCLREKNIPQINCPKTDLKKNVIESLSRRIGMPLYMPIVAFITCFLFCTSQKKKKNLFSRNIFFILSFLILLTAYLLVRYSGFSYNNMILYFSIPFIICPITYFFLIKKINSESK